MNLVFNRKGMRKLIVQVLVTVGILTSASVFASNNNAPKSGYVPAKVEDTPQFKKLKALVEADGYSYSHYEVGEGLVVWGKRDGASKGKGSKNQGIKRIPSGDTNKAYFVTWAQYFKAFSDMHRICFEDENVRKIKSVIDQLVLDTDYDYSQIYDLPAGTQWVFHPGVKYLGVCDEYSNLVIQKVSGLPGVNKAVKVSSGIGNHAWNEIWLNDGRILFCDATWYDTNNYYVDPKTGNYIIEHTPEYMPTMFTFDIALFSLGGTHYNWGDVTIPPVDSGTSIAITINDKDTKNTKETKNTKDTKDLVKFAGFFGIYLNGWHENLVSIGIPLQLGIEFNFANVAIAILGEAGIGIGTPSLTELNSPLLEWHYGGMAELYLPGKWLGLGFGYGIADSMVLDIFDWPSSEPYKTTYMRFALIFRKDSKISLYGQYYSDGNWGFGLQWGVFL